MSAIVLRATGTENTTVIFHNEFIPADAANVFGCTCILANSARIEAFHLSGLLISGLGLAYEGATPASLYSRLLC